MNFRDEYKKSAKIISPDEETLRRMENAVMARISEGSEKQSSTARTNPFILKRIALIGGAAAACAAITVTAVMYQQQNHTDATAMMSSAASSVYITSENAEAAVAETEDAESKYYYEEDAADAVTEEVGYAEDTAADVNIASLIATDDASGAPSVQDSLTTDMPAGESTAAATITAAAEEEEEYDDALPESADDSSAASDGEIADAGVYTEEFAYVEDGETVDECSGEDMTEVFTGEAVSPDGGKENPQTGGGIEGAADADTGDAEENVTYEEYIMIGKDMMTYKGNRYTKISDEALVDVGSSSGMEILNLIDKKIYMIYLDYSEDGELRITVYDSEAGECKGTFAGKADS